MVNVEGSRILAPSQALFLLSIFIIVGNTIALSLDSLHSSRESEDNSFKTALDNIHYRRRMAEKRRQPTHFESRFSKKDLHRWRDQEEDEADKKYYKRYAGNKYASSLSRNVERFLSEIGEEGSKDVRKKKKEDEEESKTDGAFLEESAEKRSYDIDMDGPSRIFTHKLSPVSDSIQERAESLASENEPEESDHDSSIKWRKKERSDIINYSRDNEHYSRFWDPERRTGSTFRRKEMRNTRSEPEMLRSSKRRYSKRRSYRNHPLISSQPNVKRSKDTKEQILGELKEILKDEDGEKREVKKRENDKDEKLKETKLDNSSDAQGNEISEGNTFEEQSKPDKEDDGDKFNEWLRDEYFKTMAMTMATMKKKRGAWGPPVSADIDEDSFPHQQLELLDDSDEKLQKFQAIEEKLESVESDMLADALQLIREGAEGREGSEAYGEQVLDKLYAANDVQKMREALDHLQRTLVHMRQYQGEEDQDSLDGDGSISTWRNFAPMKREENLAKALGVMAPNQSKRRLTVPKGVEPYLPRVSMRSVAPFVPDDSSSGQLVSVYDSPSGETSGEDTSGGSECPALDLLSSDCSVLGDIVPGGPLKRLVLEACNWHEVCYTCGGGFGLSADECDVGFVEQSHTICQDDVPCQSTARMMLVPLRQRRVFFKRSVPAICYRDPCVERFLQQG